MTVFSEYKTHRGSGASFVSAGIFGLAKEIVDGYIVEVGQFDENLGGDTTVAEFIVTVCALGAI